MIVLKIIGILLKIIGVLLLIIILLLLAAMCVPVHLFVSYEPDVTLRVKYLFLKFFILGEKPPEKPPGMIRRALAAIGKVLLLILYYIKMAISAVFRIIKKGFRWIRFKIRRKPKPKKKKPSEPKAPEKKQGFFGSLKEQRGLFGALKFFADASKKLAIKYGRICAGVFPALSFLLSNTRGYDPANPKTKDIEITPDFAGEGIRIYFIGEFTLFPIRMIGNLLWAVMTFAVSQIRLTSKLKKNKSQDK